MYYHNLLSFGAKIIISLSLLFMLSPQIQAKESTPRERPSVTEREKNTKKHIYEKAYDYGVGARKKAGPPDGKATRIDPYK